MYFQSVIQTYSSSYSYSTQKHRETEAKLDNKRQNENIPKQVNTPSDESNTNQKKGSVPQDEDKTKKE